MFDNEPRPHTQVPESEVKLTLDDFQKEMQQLCNRFKVDKPQGKKAHDILREAANLFQERNAVYGNNYERVGAVMKGFFPDGITLSSVEDFNRFHIFMLMVVKMSRYTVNWEKGHQDSIRDNTVYSAMLEMIDGYDKA